MTPHRPYLTVDNKSTSSKHQQAAGREEYVCPWCSYWQLLQNNTFEANKYIQITAEAKNKNISINMWTQELQQDVIFTAVPD